MKGVVTMKIPCFFSLLVSFAVVPKQGSCYDRTDFLVKGLEEVEPAFLHFNGTMYSGLLPVDVTFDEEPRGKLSFWLFEPEASKDSLTIWLNGGPGCSSFGAGLFMECGPVTYPHYPAGEGRTSANQPLVPNEHSWTKATNLLFVEQPVGVGFSYGPSVDSEADLSSDFYNFLVNFFSAFPDMNEKSLYIVGESYAGMYVPSIAHFIHKENKRGMKSMNLSGIGLGNGWIDAMTQGPSVIDFAYWHGMIDLPTKDTLWRAWARCEKQMHMTSPFHDFTITDECAIVENVLAAAGENIFPTSENYAPNQYDITTWDNYPILNSPDTAVDFFFRNPKVIEKLNLDSGNTNWESCIPGAGRRRERHRRLEDAWGSLPGQKLLAHDKPEAVTPYIAELLDDADIRVLVYAGDRDLSVNLQGSEQVLNNMEWSGKNDWKAANRYLWMVEGEVGGYVKTHKNLDMLLVLDSGHLVPYNVPIPALDLIDRLVNDQPFGDLLLPKIEFPFDDTPESGLVSEGSDKKSSMTSILFAILCFITGTMVGYRWNSESWQYQKIP